MQEQRMREPTSNGKDDRQNKNRRGSFEPRLCVVTLASHEVE